MAIQQIPGAQYAPNETQSKTGANGLSSLADYNSFLKLFVTQLKYQDPLSPASQEEFLAQTAQFTSVEQLSQLNQKMGDFATASRMAAASLIGRKIEGKVKDDKGAESKVSGLVTHVDYGDKGELTLGLQDGTTLPLASVSSIEQA